MALNTNVRAVFFDVVGTLLRPEPAVADIYAEIGRRHGYVWSRAEISRRFLEAFHLEERTDEANGWAVNEERERQRWIQIVSRVFRDGDDPRSLHDCFCGLWAHFAQPAAWQVDSEAGDVLRELARRGFVLGVASNFDRRLHAVLDGLSELALLRRRVISSEVGWRKPDPRFFAAVVQAAGCEAGQIFFVGDSPANDYDAANAAGLRGVLLDSGGRTPTAPRRIDRLTDLLREAE